MAATINHPSSLDLRPCCYWLLAFLLVACVGCKSYGPPLNLAEKSSFPPSRGLPNGAFLQLEDTNGLPAQWLHPPSDFLKLGPADVLEIEVIGDTASSSTLTVGPDGKIYYSILPGIFVWGLTLTEAKNIIEERLAESLRVKPELAISLRTANSPKVWVLGNIERPGVYPLSAPMTLLELVSTSGGLSADDGSPDLGRSFVMRNGSALGIDFFRLIRRGDLSQNIYLQPGDYVYIGSSFASDIYILGAVLQPNAVPYADGLSLVAAVARAGGPVPYAHMSEVVLVRGSLTSPRVATINFHDIHKGKALDVRLEPGDIIYVPFSPFHKVEKLADEVLTQFVRTLAVNEGSHAASRNAQPVQVSVPTGP